MSEIRVVEGWSHDEWVEACRLSKEFFLKTFYMIPSVDPSRPGLMPFKLRDFQSEILGEIAGHDRIIGLKARQIGWTTVAVANALHDALFQDYRPWLFISRNEGAAQEMVGKATLAYYRLPSWMRKMLPKLEAQTQGSLSFANGSRITAEPATASSGRGDAVYGTLMDECAHMEYAEEIWGAIEPLTYGPAMLFSSANGMGNFFHDVWLDSQRADTKWLGKFFPWWVVPSRTEEWYVSKRQEHRVRPWFFFQEYPSSPEEAFAKSGRVAFASDVTADVMVEGLPVKLFEWNLSEGAVEVPLSSLGSGDAELRVWREPELRVDEYGRLSCKPNYVIGVDVAEGLEHGDFTYFTVFDTFNNEQVLSCRTHLPVYYLAEMLNWVGEYYFKGLMAVERNMAGIMPLEMLANQFYYPRLYRMEAFAQLQVSEDRTPRFGWFTDRKSKAKMVLDFQRALAAGNMILHDPEFVLEAQTFVADGRGSYGATSGNHDDVIMGTLVAWQALLDSPSYSIVWADPVMRPLSFDEMEEILFAPKVPDNPLNTFLGQPARVGSKKAFMMVDGAAH